MKQQQPPGIIPQSIAAQYVAQAALVDPDVAQVRLPQPAKRSFLASIELLQVIQRQVLTPDVTMLHFARPETRLAPNPFLPGQHITLLLPGEHDIYTRSYSLCGRNDPHIPWEIAITRQAQGHISHYLCDQIQAGMVLQVLPPSGEFLLPVPLRPDIPLHFVAVGSGITPIRAMILGLVDLPVGQRPPTTLHAVAPTAERLLFQAEWGELATRHDWFTYHAHCNVSLETLRDLLLAQHATNSAAGHWYLCGSDALRLLLIAAFEHAHLPAAMLHCEQRTAATPLAATARKS